MKHLLTLLLLCVTTLAMSQPGTLDKSFADTGVFVSQTFEGECNDVIIQQDGKIISIGSGGYNNINNPGGGFLLARYNTDGTPDLSFGDSGRVATSVSSFGSNGRFGAVQEDGKIVVVGAVTLSHTYINHFAVVRYNTDGSIDSSFGVNGIAGESLEEGVTKHPSGIAVQPDGKIVAGGYTDDRINGAESPTFFLARYNPDGSPDAGFGNKGSYQERIDDVIDGGGFALQPDGKILLGGTRYATTGIPFFVRRYTSNGKPDTEFGTNGEARFYFSNADNSGSELHSIALQEDGSIVCGGIRYYGSTFSFPPTSTLVRFTGDGSVDKAFGDGRVITPVKETYNSSTRDITVQPDGKIIAGGYRVNDVGGNLAFALFRYQPNGSIDSSFGENGIALTTINNYPYANAVALQKDGRIVLGGYSITLPDYISHVTLARYNGDESRRQIVATRIKRWLQHHGITWQMDNSIRYYNVQRSNDGGVTYQPVAKIYNNHQLQYNYEDAAGKSNDLYRVAAVGKDGSRSYSNSVLVGNESSVSVFPNPVRSTMQLQGLSAESKTNISIVDFTGNVRSSATASGSTYSINTSNLKPGNYFIKIETNKTITTQPFVKE